MGIEEQLREGIAEAFAELVSGGELPAAVTSAKFSVERPRRAEHGDLATNAALAVQKLSGKAPREVAGLLKARLEARHDVASVEIAGPGFLNLRLKEAAFQRIAGEVLRAGEGYGRAASAVRGRAMVEFVSANPTGPLLISHGRGAMVGDAIASLMEATGYHVNREYYINDHGNQVRLFAASVRAAARKVDPPEGGYGGGYVHELATYLTAHGAAALASEDDGALARICVTRMLDGVPGVPELKGIKATLASIGVRFDTFTSEDALHRWGRVDGCLDELERQGRLEVREGAVFMKTAEFGDDKDRVVRKADGHTTYFAADIAYQIDKFRRGYDHLVLVLGADHHGYEGRLRAGIRAFGFDDARFEVMFFQLVNLLRDGTPYKMGKRLGNLITIDEIVDEIDEAAQRKGAGADALRYFYLSRHWNTSIDIDIELAKKATVDNPVFYLQMGYARLCSIVRRAEEHFNIEPPPWSERLAARIAHPDELAMLAQLGRYPSIVADACDAREPHRILFYLDELSKQFQSYFTRLKLEGDAILPLRSQMQEPDWRERWDLDKSLARLLWVRCIQTVYRAGLRLLGITAVERMDPLVGREPEPRED
ncbi:MAG: arginine--tRNA ligase [Myxococcales bacterium]|nr:arginine--tRNA ligase [Myxococcales bacterium]